MPRPVEARITRRWSAYDFDAFHPPQPMRPKTSPFYSWPRPKDSGSLSASLPEPLTIISYHASASRRPIGDEPPSTNTGPTGTGKTEESIPTPDDVSRESSMSSVFEAEAAVTAGSSSHLPTAGKLKVIERCLHFIVNPGMDDQQDVIYRCTRTNADIPLHAPPASTRSPGDLHFHVYMGGVQYWVVGARLKWIKTKLGDEHPTFPGRLLSHRAPHNVKYPNWVLAATYTTYIARDRRKRERL